MDGDRKGQDLYSTWLQVENQRKREQFLTEFKKSTWSKKMFGNYKQTEALMATIVNGNKPDRGQT